MASGKVLISVFFFCTETATKGAGKQWALCSTWTHLRLRWNNAPLTRYHTTAANKRYRTEGASLSAAGKKKSKKTRKIIGAVNNLQSAVYLIGEVQLLRPSVAKVGFYLDCVCFSGPTDSPEKNALSTFQGPKLLFEHFKKVTQPLFVFIAQSHG